MYAMYGAAGRSALPRWFLADALAALAGRGRAGGARVCSGRAMASRAGGALRASVWVCMLARGVAGADRRRPCPSGVAGTHAPAACGRTRVGGRCQPPKTTTLLRISPYCSCGWPGCPPLPPPCIWCWRARAGAATAAAAASAGCSRGAGQDTGGGGRGAAARLWPLAPAIPRARRACLCALVLASSPEELVARLKGAFTSELSRAATVIQRVVADALQAPPAPSLARCPWLGAARCAQANKACARCGRRPRWGLRARTGWPTALRAHLARQLAARCLSGSGGAAGNHAHGAVHRACECGAASDAWWWPGVPADLRSADVVGARGGYMGGSAG